MKKKKREEKLDKKKYIKRGLNNLMPKDSQKSGKKSLQQRKKNTNAYSFGNRTFLWRGRINFGPEGKRQILSFVGLFIPGILFLMYEAQFEHGIEAELGSVQWLLICYFVSILFFILFLWCSFSDPGYLTTPLNRNKRKNMPQIQIKKEQEFCLRYCTQCCIYRPLLTHHCKICDLCVKERDHHCPFLNNCIGIANRRPYIYFLLVSVIQEMIILAETLYQIIKPFTKDGLTFLIGIQRLSVILAAVQCLYAIILGTNLASLLIFQMKLVFKNITTDQLRRILADKNNPHNNDLELRHINDLGCFENFKMIFCCPQPPETIYSYFEDLNQDYLEKLCNYFNKKKHSLAIPQDDEENIPKKQIIIQHMGSKLIEGPISEQTILQPNSQQKQLQVMGGDSSSHKSSHPHGEKIPKQDFQDDTFCISKHDKDSHLEAPRIALREIELKDMYNHHIQLNAHLHFLPHLGIQNQSLPSYNEDGWNGGNLFGSNLKDSQIKPGLSSMAPSSRSPNNRSNFDMQLPENHHLPQLEMNPVGSNPFDPNKLQKSAKNQITEQSPAIRVLIQEEHDQYVTDQSLTEQELDRNNVHENSFTMQQYSPRNHKDQHSLKKSNTHSQLSKPPQANILGPAPYLKPITFSGAFSKNQNHFSNFYSENRNLANQNGNSQKTQSQVLQTRVKIKRTLTNSNLEQGTSSSRMLQSTNNENNLHLNQQNDNSNIKYSTREDNNNNIFNNNTDGLGITHINTLNLKQFDISPMNNQSNVTDDFNYPPIDDPSNFNKNYSSKRIKKGLHPIIKQLKDYPQENTTNINNNNNLHELGHKLMCTEFDSNGSQNYSTNFQAQLVVSAVSR